MSKDEFNSISEYDIDDSFYIIGALAKVNIKTNTFISTKTEFLLDWHNVYISDLGILHNKIPNRDFGFTIVADESMAIIKKFKTIDDAIDFWFENRDKILTFKKHFEIDLNSIRVKKVYIQDKYILEAQNVIANRKEEYYESKNIIVN